MLIGGDLEPTPTAAPIEPASTTSAHGPDPTTSTSWGLLGQVTQPTPAAHEETPAVVEVGGDFDKGGTVTHSASSSTSTNAW